ncbi:ESX secretion-associated protein EspG [Mycobacterium intracellulare]|uniref:ESX secretion-associated protein EspG n=1 Tax=Mycobacterium intracellulare TaxID=1767 RepID=UPI001EEE3A7A|nr:ESX secretion-associated protein EspG [Mycobacterium intracellulare]MEE3755331.1 ESX secretion-associated protein EspG [Mycobacterium intracellulare]
MFSALHWDYLHRAGLVVPYPAALGVVAGAGSVDHQLRCELLHDGVVVESGDRLVLESSRRPVFEAFAAPPVTLFGTTLLYRDAVHRPRRVEDVPEALRELAELTAVVVPQSKFLVAVTDAVVAAAVQFRGSVSLTGVDSRHADSLIQAARLLWEALAPGEPHESLQDVTLPMPALDAVSKVRLGLHKGEDREQGLELASTVLAEAGVGADRVKGVTDLLGEPPLAAAQVCVSVWDDHRRVASTDAAIGLAQFGAGAVLSVPSWRLDGSCHVTYMPATAARWEKEVVEFVAQYRYRAKSA